MAYYKRILHELHNKIPEKMLDLNLNHKFTFVSLDTDIVSKEYGIVNTKTDLVELKIIIPSDYPFKPPSVFVTKDNHTPPYPTVIPLSICNFPNIKYDKWSVSIIHGNNPYKNCGLASDCDLFSAWAFSIIRRPTLLRYWHGNIPNKKDCLCCQSIICSNNWSPSKMLSDILAEYVTRRDFKINCRPLMQRWIGVIFNNDRWVIPDDIILKIVKMTSSFYL